MPQVIHVAGIRKTYGRVVAVDEVSFDGRRRRDFRPDRPKRRGQDDDHGVYRGPADARSRHHLRPGARPGCATPTRCRTGSACSCRRRSCRSASRSGRPCDLWASLYRTSVDGNHLLQQLGLADKRNAWFMTLSGGQKQRLFIALALINDPEVVFLDELTTGLDPQARRAIWDLVRGIRARGKTVFMTTHLMEEAERLCDRVAIIDHGRTVDIDTPSRLVSRHCPERAVVVTTADEHRRRAFSRIPRVTSVTRADGEVTIRGRRRRSGRRRHPVPVGAPHPGHRFPDRRADARGRVPETDGPLDSRLRTHACCADCGR